MAQNNEYHPAPFGQPSPIKGARQLSDAEIRDSQFAEYAAEDMQAFRPERFPPRSLDLSSQEPSGVDFCSQTTTVSSKEQSEEHPNGEKGPKAVWDYHRKKAFVEICMQQKRDGDRAGGFSTKGGASDMAKDFFVKIGIKYSKAQFKNHWDSSKKDWIVWKWLKAQTGTCYDPIEKTYTATLEWWAKNNKLKKGRPEKFKDDPLLFKEEMNTLFQNTVADGETCHQTRHKSSRVQAESDAGSSHQDEVEFQTEDQGYEPIECNNPNPTGNIRPKVKNARRGSGGVVLAKSIDGLADHCKHNIDRKEKAIEKAESYSFERCIDILQEMQIPTNGLEWVHAVDCFAKRSKRQVFVTLTTTEQRILWLKKQSGFAF